MKTENLCFCELAPLYALELLDGAEATWVEQQVTQCSDLAEELAAYQDTVAALSYSVPERPIAKDLKQRLFDRLALGDCSAASEDQSMPLSPFPHLVAVRSQDLQWQPHSVPGMTIAIAYTDPVKREIVGFLRAEAGVHYPFHHHQAIEQILILEGDLVINDQSYQTGDYIRSSTGSSHAPYTLQGCYLLFHTAFADDALSFGRLQTSLPTESKSSALE